MKAFGKPSSERGVIVLISLILLVVMTTMGLGLVYTAGRNDKGASMTINHTQALQSSETCIQEIVQWMEVKGATAPPCKDNSGRCWKVKNKTMASSDYLISGGQKKHKIKMARHKYQCEVSLLTTLSEKNDLGTNTGFSVGQSSAYGGASTQTKYIYLIRTKSNATTSGANVEVVASMIF